MEGDSRRESVSHVSAAVEFVSYISFFFGKDRTEDALLHPFSHRSFHPVLQKSGFVSVI